ncbi:bifunctional diaminohydroxyphosphoribosylaminopyrimidine deaminase/5-amino-6-(5-phosphoribosylamino)uracil reductase RibD [Paenibacillus sp. Marseille-Q4541]|uniref:bifunctional diaminohydroxyphosphoribosylaminopyrimidine deaminase/5-amino-6-(5-phosphoribosylamino)uracil reductase RibD n=1 Tax=Paenibacillus sp. Marseille-Q4541 TaxID=2831522 RepID=UPI001BA7EC12|nr:bifunctional diaminohydroxyphosphoribosylaminopyrimidine deaminase/5-amino-6-(5-phosphoribosylamino)uracil reductase RibD [Paenibacillus sp. Marseille-Q4541]
MELMNDEFYMSLALDMAERAQGQTGINPVVGCVIVKDGRMVGLGTHLQRGKGHAEVHALAMAGSEAEGSTVYVTLEPCSHYGKTPPCSEKLISMKVKKVIVACEDPNHQVAGKGVEILRKHGIEVEVGILRDRARRLNEQFIKYITTGIPFVTLKTASTLDGKIATKSGDSKWISNDQAREHVHMLRHRHQGIMVGVGTVITDNPELTTRLPVDGINPIRIIVDSKLRTPRNAKLVKDGLAPTILLTTDEADFEAAKYFENLGVQVVRCGPGPRVDLPTALSKLSELEIGSILLEGGGTLSGAMLEKKLVDRLIMFIAPKIVGGYHNPGSFQFEGVERMSEAIKLNNLEVETMGDNIRITGLPVWPESG